MLVYSLLMKSRKRLAHDVTGTEAVRWSVCRNTMLLAVFCIGGKGASWHWWGSWCHWYRGCTLVSVPQYNAFGCILHWWQRSKLTLTRAVQFPVPAASLWNWHSRTDPGKCTHLYDKTQGNKEIQALSAENCLLQVQLNKAVFGWKHLRFIVALCFVV